MSGGGKGGGTGDSTQSMAPWGPVQPYITGQPVTNQKGGIIYGAPNVPGLLPSAGNLFANGPGFYTPQNSTQQTGQNMALGFANNFGSMYSPYMSSGKAGLTGMGGNTDANNAMRFQLNAPDIKNNPYLGSYMDAATRPLQQQLDMQTMPGIRASYGDAGQYGSSRQGVAEGVAQGLTNQAIGDTRAQIANQAYGQGLSAQASALGQSLDQQSKAMALYPQLMQAGLTPSNIYSSVGNTQQQDANSRQTDPYNVLNWYNGVLNPIAGLGGTQKVNQSGSGSMAQNIAGGAMDLAALFALL